MYNRRTSIEMWYKYKERLCEQGNTRKLFHLKRVLAIIEI